MTQSCFTCHLKRSVVATHSLLVSFPEGFEIIFYILILFIFIFRLINTVDFQPATMESILEKEVSDVQWKIPEVEDELDITISDTKDNAEQLELADNNIEEKADSKNKLNLGDKVLILEPKLDDQGKMAVFWNGPLTIL